MKNKLAMSAATLLLAAGMSAAAPASAAQAASCGFNMWEQSYKNCTSSAHYIDIAYIDSIAGQTGNVTVCVEPNETRIPLIPTLFAYHVNTYGSC